MAEIDIELDGDMFERAKQLALRHYGDTEDASVARVIESAAEMRLLSLKLVPGGGNDIEEPIYYLREEERNPLWNGFWKNI